MIARGRLWFYTNYHCNLACAYCLTDSRPDAPRRMLARERVLALAEQACDLGFEAFGVTGGEPFLRTDMPSILAELGARLPTIVLTNGTLFTPALVDRLRPLANLPIAYQISIDSADGAINDAGRAPESLDRARAGIAALLAAKLRVRIGSTVDGTDPSGVERLCAWHRALGIGDDDHVVRPIVARGRARSNDLGFAPAIDDLPAELTITAEGAFWSPAGPTVADGRLELTYLLTRTIEPLAIPLGAMTRYANGRTAYEPALRVT